MEASRIFSLLVRERCHDSCPDTRAADCDPSDDRSLFVKILSNAVQPREIDDAQPEAHQTPGREVEEDDRGGEGGGAEAGRGQGSPHQGGQPPAQSRCHVGSHRA